MKYWELIAENLKKRGWSLGWVSAIDSTGRTIWIVDAHRGDGRRFIEQRVETTHLETQEASAVDPALHRSVVVRAEPVDHCLPTILAR